MSLWRREPLEWHHSKRFSKVIRKGDEIECTANGMSVRASLDWAVTNGGGESWAVIEDPLSTPLGVYGWTMGGAVWSYWQHLTPLRIKELMRVTPRYVSEMVDNAAARGVGPLANLVWAGNREALAWLRASHCFEINLDAGYKIGDKEFFAFRARTGEELKRLCAIQ